MSIDIYDMTDEEFDTYFEHQYPKISKIIDDRIRNDEIRKRTGCPFKYETVRGHYNCDLRIQELLANSVISNNPSYTVVNCECVGEDKCPILK